MNRSVKTNLLKGLLDLINGFVKRLVINWILSIFFLSFLVFSFTMAVVSVSFGTVLFEENTVTKFPGLSNSAVTWGDLDNDGYLDLLLTGSTDSGRIISYIYQYDDKDSFTLIKNLLPVSHGTVALGDYDNDNDLDLLLTGYSDDGIISKILRNDGDYLFNDTDSNNLLGLYNSSGTWCDFDNDGDQDLLLTGSSKDSGDVCRVYLNESGKFKQFVNLLEVFSSSVACGDYNNDGLIDIILAGNTVTGNVTKVYKNNGRGFDLQNFSLGGISKGMVAWGDYDNDGLMDFVLTGEYSTGHRITYIYKNINGIFSKFQELIGVSNSSIAWGDYDNDGDLDILLTGRSTEKQITKIYQNNNGHFEDIDAALPGVRDGAGLWGDYDRDGHLDILLVGYTDSGSITKIYRNNGIASNVAPKPPDNLEADTKLDTVFFKWHHSVDNKPGSASLTYNLRVGTKPNGTEIVSPMTDANVDTLLKIPQMGNVNHNTGWTIDSLQEGTYYWSVQAVDHSFVGSPFADEKTFIIRIPPKKPHNLIADARDRKVKLTWGANDENDLAGYYLYRKIFTNPDFERIDHLGLNTAFIDTDVENTISYQYFIIAFDTAGNESEPSDTVTAIPDLFKEISTPVPGVKNGAIACGDLDNDNDLDLVLTGATESSEFISEIYLNEDGIFDSSGNRIPGIANGSIVLGDFNNDNDLDILLTGNSNSGCISRIYKNSGEGTFSYFQDLQPAVAFGSAAWGDYDNDGDADIILTGKNSSAKPISVILMNDNGTFTDIAAELTGVFNSSVAWEDYDLDGDLDLLLAGDTGKEHITRLFENNSQIFIESTVGLPGVAFGSVSWGDYDDDGYPDILLTGNNGDSAISRVYGNSGNKIFEDTGILLPGITDGSAGWVDFDNDGDPDIFLCGQDNDKKVFLIYENDDRNFKNFPVSLPGVTKSAVAWGNFYDEDENNNNALDIFLTGNSDNGTIIKLYLNRIAVTKDPPSRPSGLVNTVTGRSVTLSWNKATDDHPGSLTFNLYLGKLDSANNMVVPPLSHLDEGVRKLPGFGNTRYNNEWMIESLAGGSYTWQVQAIDNAFIGSRFSEPDNFTIKDTTNQPPGVENSIPDTALVLSLDTLLLNLEEQKVFYDPDDDALSYSASSSDTSIVTAATNDDTILTVIPVAKGCARIIVTADDGRGGKAATTFTVTVVAKEDRPLAPGLEFPEDNSFINDSTPGLIFTVPQDNNDDALHFIVELASNKNFDSRIIYDSRANSDFNPQPPIPPGRGRITFTVPEPLEEKGWYWRVKAWDGSVFGDYSDTNHFTIDTTRPFTSDHVPAKGAKNVSVNADIKLHITDTSSGVKKDSISMSVDGKQVTPDVTGNSTECVIVYRSKAALNYMDTVFVAIIAKDFAANVLDTIYSFITCDPKNNPPYKPTLKSPTNNAMINNINPAFVFDVPGDKNEDSLNFQVEIANNDSFNAPLIYQSINNASFFYPMPPLKEGVGQDTLKLPNPLSEGHWWWRVKTFDCVNYSEYSDTLKFTIDTTKPVFADHYPAKGDTGIPLHSPITVHVSDELSGINPLKFKITVDDSIILHFHIKIDSFHYQLASVQSLNLKCNTEVMVSIIASDYAGNGSTDSYSFTTTSRCNNPPGAPLLVEPSPGEYLNDSYPTLKFTVPGDEDGDFLHFLIELANDINFADAKVYDSRSSTDGFDPEPPLNQGAGQVIFTIPDSRGEGTWWWRVSAWDGYVFGDTSSTESFIIDLTAPKIVHDTVSLAVFRTSKSIEAIIKDNLGTQAAMLFFREGGKLGFTQITMSQNDHDNFSGLIPGNYILERGLEYYFTATDYAGNCASFPSKNPEINPHIIQVFNEDYKLDSTIPETTYQMISVPIMLEKNSAQAVLADDFGGHYDSTEWRILHYFENGYIEYRNNKFPGFQPGKGFWLISKVKKNLFVGSGKSVHTGQNYPLKLQPGWNQVGSPFAFRINWLSAAKPQAVEDSIWGYDGHKYLKTTILEPWSGYWVKNLGAESTVVEIAPVEYSESLAKATPELSASENLQSNEWQARIVVQCQHYRDQENYIGCLHDAAEEWDRHDFSEPPVISRYVSLYFPHKDWAPFPGLYTGDFRPGSADGQFWDFCVQTNIPYANVVLTFTDCQNLPASWELVLLDKTGKISMNFLAQQEYVFLSGRDQTVREFRIVAGQAEFVEQNRMDFSGIPQHFYLAQNYPNPFNPDTRVGYELPTTSRVKIAVYNVTGQLIQTLVAERLSAGRYEVAWNGTLTDGSRAASGVYLVRMEAAGFSSVRKMVLAR